MFSSRRSTFLKCLCDFGKGTGFVRIEALRFRQMCGEKLGRHDEGNRREQLVDLRRKINAVRRELRRLGVVRDRKSVGSQLAKSIEKIDAARLGHSGRSEEDHR